MAEHVYIRVCVFTSYLPRRSMRPVTVLLGLLLISETPQHCYCVRVSIVDDVTAYPFLRNIETPTVIMRWDSGGSINLLNGCKLIRITRRGVRCVEASAQLIPGWETSFNVLASCVALNTALCVTEQGNRFFPADKVFVSESSVSKCVHGQGRSLVPDIQMDNNATNTTGDDISLCDVLDSNLDIVYDPVNNRIHTKQLSDASGLYGLISVLILVIVVLTAEALADESRSHLSHNIAAWVILTTSSLLVLMGVDGRMHPFVTEDDRAFLTISAIYVITSTVYWASSLEYFTSNLHQEAKQPKQVSNTTTAPANIGPQTQRDGINAMLGSVHFAICVLYGTPDNTYVSGFFFLFLFRCMQKFHAIHHNPEEWTLCANTILILDVVYTVTIFSSGILPHITNESEIILYAGAQFVVCHTIAANWVHSTTNLNPLIKQQPIITPPLPPPAPTPPLPQIPPP